MLFLRQQDDVGLQKTFQWETAAFIHNFFRFFHKQLWGERNLNTIVFCLRADSNPLSESWNEGFMRQVSISSSVSANGTQTHLSWYNDLDIPTRQILHFALS